MVSKWLVNDGSGYINVKELEIINGELYSSMGEQPISLNMSETNIEKWGWSEFNSQYDSLLLSFSIIVITIRTWNWG